MNILDPDVANLDIEWYFLFTSCGLDDVGFGKYVGGFGTIWSAKMAIEKTDERFASFATITNVDDGELVVVCKGSGRPDHDDDGKLLGHVWEWEVLR